MLEKTTPGVPLPSEYSAGRPRLARPYHVVTAWLAAAPEVRIRRTEQQVCDYKRIARIPRHMGERLDALGASYEQMRWIAGAVDHASDLERRYLALTKLLEHGDPERRSPGVAFRALMASMPKVGRAAKREERRVPRGKERRSRQ